ncbi:MAG: sugar ABC transporter substrate-binding protein, partial [Spirochaetales bacterium]
MKKIITLVCVGLLVFASAGMIFAAGGTEKGTTAAAASSDGWVPYYKKADFKAFVALPEKTKEQLGTVPDEMKVMPVDRVAPELVKIAVIGAATNPFFDIIKQGVDDAAELLIKHNVKVDWIIPGSSLSSSDVNAVMEALLVKKYNAITTLVYNEGQIPYVEKAVNQGVPVGVFCADAQPNKGMFFIGQDLYAAGKTAGRAMGKLLDGKGKVAVITGFFNVNAHELRRKGFEDVIKQEFPNITIVGKVENLDQADKARTQAIDFMTANPDLAGIYVTAGGPIGAAQAVKEAGKSGKVKIVAFDPLPQTLESLKDGSIQALIGQNPYAEGRDPIIRIFNYLMEGKLPDARFLYTRDDVVTKET